MLSQHQKDEIVRLMQAGKTATQVGVAVGATRGQINGYWFRWKRNEAKAAKAELAALSQPEPPEPSPPAPAAKRPPARLGAVPAKGIPLEKLPERLSACRWPLWPSDGPPSNPPMFCGAKCQGPYCEAHARMAYSARPLWGPPQSSAPTMNRVGPEALPDLVA